MADTIQFDLVSPERRLAATEAKDVMLPGAEGDLTVMAQHLPLITTLRPGLIRVNAVSGAEEYVVSGGFAEINGESISVLAEHAFARQDITQDAFDAIMAELKLRQEKALAAQNEAPGAVDEASKHVADMTALGAAVGLTVN